MMRFFEVANMVLFPSFSLTIFIWFLNDMFLRDNREIKTLENRLFKALHGGITEREMQQITMLTSWENGKAGE